MSPALAMRRLAPIIAVLLLAALPASAMASGQAVINDCTDDGELSRTYSQNEYKQALADLPADLDEYSDCRSLIRAAQLKRATTTGSKKGGGSSPAKKKKSKRKQAAAGREVKEAVASDAPVKFGGAVIHPSNMESSASIPAPLVVVLVLTLLGALGAGAIAIRRLVLDRRSR